VVQADVSKAVAIQHAYDEVMKAFDKLDIIVNNAGTRRAMPFNERGRSASPHRPANTEQNNQQLVSPLTEVEIRAPSKLSDIEPTWEAGSAGFWSDSGGCLLARA
jgi:NAD(P)-dependent dehydrogenase (short-subunit alcohol dehydrogenase family)